MYMSLSFKELVCSVAEPMFIERLLRLKRSPPTAVDARASHNLTQVLPRRVSRRLMSSRQALARFLRVLPVLAVRAARLLPLVDCSVQCARQQLFTVHSDAAFGAHVPELIKAARCVHVLSHGHAVSVTVRSMLCVSFPCAAKLLQLSSTCSSLLSFVCACWCQSRSTAAACCI